MYSFLIDTPEVGSATIKMNREALGGKDAMDFANTIQNIPTNIKVLILDMEKLELVNSSGLGMITKANNYLRSKNIELVLSSVPENVMRLLEITRLNRIFKII